MADDALETFRLLMSLELDKESCPSSLHGSKTYDKFASEAEAVTKEEEEKKKKSLESDAEAAAKVEEEKEMAATKEVAYLKYTGDLFLFPHSANVRILPDVPEECPREGEAREFVWKLYKDLNKTVDPQRKHEIFCKEIQLYVPHHQGCCVDESVIPESITSLDDLYKVSVPLYRTFHRKCWFLNDRDGDDYQLLCLRYHPMSEFAYVTDWEPIEGLVCLNYVGNTLEADLQYKDFRDMVFAELQWDDTEVDGVTKAIDIRDKYFPFMKDLTIAWVLQEWVNYNYAKKDYWTDINRMCQLWYWVVEGRVRVRMRKEFKKAVLDIYNWRDKSFIKSMFDELLSVKEYIDDSLGKGLDRKVDILIQEYFEVCRRTPEPKCNKGSYILYVKEKIRKAIQLGIVRKEDVEKFKAGAQLLEEIEQENPGVFYESDH